MTSAYQAAWVAALVCSVHLGGSFAQDYPVRAVRIVTPGAGGGGDIVARLLAQELSPALGQQVIVDNRSGVIAPDLVLKAPADGYTLHLNGSGLWIAPLMMKQPSYEAIRDFAPIAIVASAPNIVAVHPSLPAKSIRELIALAKARPRALDYACGSLGAPSHLAGELFASMAGIALVRIPYKSAGAALSDLMGGQVQVMFANVGAALPHVKSGRLKALAVTSAEPSALAPGLPTVAAAGLPGYDTGSVHALLAPSGTPTSIVARLNQEVGRALRQQDLRDRLLNAALEPAGGGPEQLATLMKADIARMGPLIRSIGISLD